MLMLDDTTTEQVLEDLQGLDCTKFLKHFKPQSESGERAFCFLPGTLQQAACPLPTIDRINIVAAASVLGSAVHYMADGQRLTVLAYGHVNERGQSGVGCYFADMVDSHCQVA